MRQELSYSREKLLVHGIDVKYILFRFLEGLPERRRRNFINHVFGNKPYYEFSPWNRMEVRADKRRLLLEIKRYGSH